MRDPRVEAAFRAVRRHWFLPDTSPAEVYRDQAIVTSRDVGGVPISSSSQPALMALMLEQLDVEPGMAVLEIGAGTGYNAALLGSVVGPGGSVVTVDIDPGVTGPAARHLSAAGATNVSVVTADAWARLAGGGTFDRIEATVAVWDLAPAWVEGLRPGGVLVVPLCLRAGEQASIAFRKIDGGLRGESVHPCGFMRMRGPGAGEALFWQLGPWTVGMDAATPETVRVLAELLATDPVTRPAPALSPGWFTVIALTADDAVRLSRHRREGLQAWAGVLHTSPPGLAVVDGRRIKVFGSDRSLDRLLDLIDRTPAVDPTELAISVVPTGAPIDTAGAITTLVRPHFTYVVRRM